jgi:hypothetical protein
MVLYTDDEDRANELATLLVNEPTPGPMIIVVDDCSLTVRLNLQNTLRGCRESVRCICISDGTEMPRSPAPELSISKMSSIELEKVLRENYPGVPFDRLRTYAHLANGFVRLAADMCQCDGQIKTAGNISPAIQSVRDYYQARLTDAQRRAVEAIALVTRVRRKGEGRTQLDSLCEWLTEDRHALEEQLAEIKDAPGFAERGALYYRVTPEIIAIVAFENAWKRWGDGREEKFLSAMPKDIQEAFLERVSESASPEVRKTVHLFFRRFSDSFSPQQLSDPESVKKLITLINTEPATYLPLLRSVVYSATDEDFPPGPSWIDGEWGPRRQLVWLAEGLAQFREFFPDAEAVLFQLAVHETELDISNNATNVWQRLFCMQMSGTPLPFSERLRLLGERLKMADETRGELIAGALRTIFNFQGVRLLGAPVIAGRIPEPDWYPENRDAYRAAIGEGLSVLVRASRHLVAAISAEARSTLVSSTELLTRLGWLDDVKQFVTKSQLDEDTRAKLVADLKYFLVRRKAPDDQEAPKAYLDQVEAWTHDLEPGTLHGRLVEQVGTNSWSHYGREKDWEAALASLAQQLLVTPQAFEVELPWLLSPEAKSAFELGHALGAEDIGANYLDIILSKSEPTQAALVRGYVSGVVHRARISPFLLNERLDQLEEKDPLLAFQVAHAAGNSVNVFARAIRLIKDKKIPAFYLRNFTFWVGDRHITNEEVLTAINTLLPVAETGDRYCCDVILDFLGARSHGNKLGELLSLGGTLVWKAITVVTAFPGREAFWWAKVLREAAPTDPALAIHLACTALVSDDFQFSDQAKGLVANFAGSYPEEVMEEVGKIMLSRETGWHFFVRKYPIFTSMPPTVVITWLEKHGVDASRRIARHLPQPYLNNGVPSLHPLTEYVLGTFENDDHTFSEFCAGAHSLQVYVGDLATTREREAERARPFLNHNLRRVREWAHFEMQSAAKDAQWHREQMDEIGL